MNDCQRVKGHHGACGPNPVAHFSQQRCLKELPSVREVMEEAEAAGQLNLTTADVAAPPCLGCGGQTRPYGSFRTEEWECAAEKGCGTFTMKVQTATDMEARVGRWLDAGRPRRSFRVWRQGDSFSGPWCVILQEAGKDDPDVGRGWTLDEAFAAALEAVGEDVP